MPIFCGMRMIATPKVGTFDEQRRGSSVSAINGMRPRFYGTYPFADTGETADPCRCHGPDQQGCELFQRHA